MHPVRVDDTHIWYRLLLGNLVVTFQYVLFAQSHNKFLIRNRRDFFLQSKMENRRLLFAVVWTILLIQVALNISRHAKSFNLIILFSSTNFQATRIRSESTESVPTAQITHTDNEYVGKYLPEMWRALKRANADDVHLLQMKKLEKPANNLYQSMKSCIVKYLQAIKPVAFVKLSAESNNSCSVRVVKEHVDILRFASKKSFRCLHLYKIGITNVYADAPQVFRINFILTTGKNLS